MRVCGTRLILRFLLTSPRRYVLVQKRSLDATVAFTALAWIFQMEWSIVALPDLFNQLWTLLPNLRRLGYATLSSGPALYFWIPTFLMVLMYACAICAHSLW